MVHDNSAVPPVMSEPSWHKALSIHSEKARPGSGELGSANAGAGVTTSPATNTAPTVRARHWHHPHRQRRRGAEDVLRRNSLPAQYSVARRRRLRPVSSRSGFARHARQVSAPPRLVRWSHDL